MANKQSLLQKFGRLSEAKKLFLFLIVFAVIGGGYMAYSSFAASISCGPVQVGLPYVPTNDSGKIRVNVDQTCSTNTDMTIAAAIYKGNSHSLSDRIKLNKKTVEGGENIGGGKWKYHVEVEIDKNGHCGALTGWGDTWRLGNGITPQKWSYTSSAC